MKRNRNPGNTYRWCPIVSLLALLFLLGVFSPVESRAWTGITTRVSVDSAGIQGNGSSSTSSVSADGRYVAFVSFSSNLVSGDTNNVNDVFVHDRVTGQTTRVSVDSAGNPGNDNSYDPCISADGRYVAFDSFSSNLIVGDTNGFRDVFVHDRVTGQTTRVSVDSAGNQGNNVSINPKISADGRYVAFQSAASNLVPGDTTTLDVFVHDRQTGGTTKVSVDSAGTPGNMPSYANSISPDGRYVVLRSYANNLVPGDTNGYVDVFVHDRVTGQTTRVSVDSAGNQGNNDSSVAVISADGRYVAFSSDASNLVGGDSNGFTDIFVHDRLTGQTTLVSVDSSGNQGNNDSSLPSISADGRYVAFQSVATNLVPGGGFGVFVYDRVTGHTTRVNVDSSGNPGNNKAYSPSISADGRYVAFDSFATNLVPGDTNGSQDIFVHQLLPVRAVPNDFDGDGIADIAIYRPAYGYWFIIRSSDGTTQSVAYGISEDIPVPGDYDGDGKTDIAIYRPSTGGWFIVRSSDGTTQAMVYGVVGDIPVPGDYDGDGITDIAIYRPSTGGWFIVRSSDGTTQAAVYGVVGDIPVQARY